MLTPGRLGPQNETDREVKTSRTTNSSSSKQIMIYVVGRFRSALGSFDMWHTRNHGTVKPRYTHGLFSQMSMFLVW